MRSVCCLSHAAVWVWQDKSKAEPDTPMLEQRSTTVLNNLDAVKTRFFVLVWDHFRDLWDGWQLRVEARSQAGSTESLVTAKAQRWLAARCS